MLNLYSGNDYSRIHDFLYDDICIADNVACTDSGTGTGLLGTISEFHNLLKISYYTYKDNIDNKAYLNSGILSQMMNLLHSVIVPAHDYFFDSALAGVVVQNDRISLTFLVCMVIYIIAGCVATLLVWTPYIQHKKTLVIFESKNIIKGDNNHY